jgi:hypothetical protein
MRPTPVKCCTRCTLIIDAAFSINLSDVSAARKTCLICALLLRSAKAHCNTNELNVYIVQEKSWLKIGSDGPRILQLCSNTG